MTNQNQPNDPKESTKVGEDNLNSPVAASGENTPPATRTTRKPKTQAEFRALELGDVQDDPKFNLDEMAAHTKYLLSQEPKVTKYIPLDLGEKRGVVQPFTINGYRIRILKGTEVSVPMSIAALIDNFLQNTVQEDSPFNLDNEEAMNTSKDGVRRREAMGR